MQADAPQEVEWEKKQITKFDISKILKQTCYLIAMVSFICFFGLGDAAGRSMDLQLQYTSENCNLLMEEVDGIDGLKPGALEEYKSLKEPEYTIGNKKPNLYSGDIFGLKNLYVQANATLLKETP